MERWEGPRCFWVPGLMGDFCVLLLAVTQMSTSTWTAKTTQKIQTAMRVDNFSYPGELPSPLQPP